MVLSQKTPWPAAPLPAVSPPSFGFPVGRKPMIRQASPHLTTRARDKNPIAKPLQNPTTFDKIGFFSRRAEKAKYLTKSSEVMRNFAGEKKKHSSTRAE